MASTHLFFPLSLYNLQVKTVIQQRKRTVLILSFMHNNVRCFIFLEENVMIKINQSIFLLDKNLILIFFFPLEV